MRIICIYIVIASYLLLENNVLNAQCNVSLGGNISLCLGSSATLTASTSGFSGAISYTWTPTGSGSSNNVSPGTTTTYTVTATDGSCTATASATVTVHARPTATFTFNNNNSCSGTPISFSSSVTGGQGPYTYSWNFGGAGNSAQANPTFTFNTTGSGTQNYNVTLTVTDANGCTDSYSQTVRVDRLPSAAIEDQDIFTPWVFCDGGGVHQLFINNTSSTLGSNSNYHIDWGDGTTPYNSATLPNGTSHIYSGQGYFNLSLTVTGSNGCTSTMTQDVFIGGNPEIGLANPGGTVGICASRDLTFPITNFSNNPPGTIYTITVNDGSAPVVFTHPPPAFYTHSFNSTSCGFTSLGGFDNAFHVRIIAENPCGTTSALVEPIRLGSPPEADYTFTPPPDICIGDPVVFTSEAEGYFNNNGVCIDALTGGWFINPGSGWTVVSGSLNSPDPITVNFSQAQSYDVTLVVSNPCGNDTTIKSVCVAEPPNADYSIPSNSGCAPLTIPTTNTSNTITSCANTIYAWTVIHNGSLCTSGGSWNFQSGNAGSQSPTITFNGSGTYTLTLTVTNKCGTSTEIQTITVDEIPEIAIAPIADFCAGNSINPVAVINSCYSTLSNVNWSFPGGTPSSSNSQIPGAVTYGSSGTFTVTLSTTNACGTTTDNETFTITPPPAVPVISSNSPVCEGEAITINTNPVNGVTYTWSGPGSFSSNQQNISINNATPANAGTYRLVVTDALGCTNTVSIDIVVNPLPTINVNPPAPVCIGESVQLNASGALSFSWSPSTGLSATTGATVTANPGATTTYTVTGTDGNGCSNITSVIVTINPLPNITITPSQSICVGESATLTANNGVSYTWSPSTGLSSTVGNTVTANPNTTTTYSVTGTDGNGCVNTAATTVTVNPIPNVTVSPDPTICAGETTNLNANGAATYTWSPATGLSSTTGSNITANPTIPTTYTVTGTSAQGCQNTAQVIVNVNPLPPVIVNSETVCSGNSAILNADGATSYSWSPATGLSSTTGMSVTATPVNTTTYTVTGTDDEGCMNTATSIVTINLLPTVSAGLPQELCNQNIPVQLSGSPQGGTWSGTGVTSGGSFNPFTAGVGPHLLTYSYTDGSGCSNSDTVTISVIDPITPDAGNDFVVCKISGVIDLNTQNNPAPPGGTWSGPGVSFNTFIPTLAPNGHNMITYTVGSGTCEASDEIEITVNPLPDVTVNSESICVGNSVTLTANNAVTYTWSPSAGLSATTGNSVNASPLNTTVYTVTGTSPDGCVNSATATVTVNPLPAISAGPDQVFCNQDTTIRLSGTPGNGAWSGTGVNAAGDFNPFIAGTGIYQIIYTLTDGNGCSNTDTTEITVTDLTNPVAGNDIIACRDAAAINLNTQNNPSPPGGIWSGTGVSGNNFNPANANIGQNTITYTIGSGTCRSSDEIFIIVNALPAVTVNSPTICKDESVLLEAKGAGTYTWSPAGGLSAITGASVIANPIATSTYTVTGVDSNSCSNTASSTVTINPLPTVEAGPGQTFCDQNIPVLLSGSPANGTWSGTGVTPAGSFNPLTAGLGSHQLIYTVTNGNNCSNYDSVTMTVINPSLADAGNDFSLCSDAAPVDLDVQNNPTPAGGTWAGPGVANNIFTAASASIGNNTIVYSIGTGTCLSRDTIEITVNALPNIMVNSETICKDDSVTLTATGAVSYTWNPTSSLSDSTGSTVMTFPVISTNYTVRGTDTNSCVNTNTALVTVNALPTVEAGSGQTFCEQNIPVLLSGSPGNGTWSGTGVTPTGSFNPSTAGEGSHELIYTVTDGSNCSNYDSVTMIVIPPSLAEAGNDFSVCLNASPVNLDVQNNPTPAGGTWAGPGVANNIFTAANASIGINTIIYTIGTGTCLSRDTIEITVNDLPNITVNSPTICEQGSATLTADGAASYSWSPVNTLSDSVGKSVTASPVVTTIYAVRGTDSNSCVNSSTSTVSVNPLPAVDAGIDQTFCDQNIPVQLTGNPINGTWSGNGVSPGGSFNPSSVGMGTYPLIYGFTDSNNCTNSDTVDIGVIEPTIPDAGNNFPLCRDAQPVDLNVQNNPTPAGGTWAGTSVNNGIFNPGAATFGQNVIVYSIGNGTCLTRDTITATVNPLPIVSVNSGTICEEDFITLTCTGANSYTWSPLTYLNIISGSVAEASPPVSMMYIVTGIDTNGCADKDSAFVKVNPLPAVEAGPDTSTCNQPQFPTQLNGGPVAGTWSGSFIDSSGLFTPSGNPADTGSFTIMYSFTDGNGCQNTDSTKVKVITPVYAIAGPDRSFCFDDPAGILTGFSPAGGIWAGGGIVNGSSGLFDPSLAGVGTGKLYYNYGTGTCATHDSLTVTINPVPTPKLSFNTTCINDTTFFTDLSIANSGSINSWQWDFGNGHLSNSQNPSHYFSPEGNYIVSFEMTNAVGCSSDTTFSVTIHPLPTVDFTHDSMVCPDSILQLSLTTIDALNYYWDFGDSTTGTGVNPTHAYANVGRYEIKLVAETEFGCVDSSTSDVHVPEPPNAKFTFNPKVGCAPLDVSFFPLLPADWTGLTYMWIFGNGDTTFGPIPPDYIRFQAGANGADTSYVVQFLVFSHTCQNFGRYVDTVKIVSEPTAVVTAATDPGCGYTDVEFTNVTNPIFDTLHINYGDGDRDLIPASDYFFDHTFLSSADSDTTFTVRYYASGSNCSSVPGEIQINVAPNTVKADFNVQPDQVCLGGEFILSSNATGGSYFYYDLGNGIVPNSNSLNQIPFTFSDSGSYTIYQYVYSADSCSFGMDSASVTVNPVPLGDFQFDPPPAGCLGAEVNFIESSKGAVKGTWYFGDNTVATEVDSPTHIYSSGGTYEVLLVTENEFGCLDSIQQPVTIDILSKGLYVPNALSPEFGDPKVREFKPAGQCMESYHLRIFNTWGELVWESDKLTPEGEPAEGWNGRHMNTGELLKQDVYVWKIDAVFLNNSVWQGKDYDDGRVRKIGSVTLLR